MKNFFLIGLIFLITTSALAAPSSSLYQVEVPVAEQNNAARKIAVQQGLKEVLIKASGNSHVLENKKLSDQLANAENYLQEFSYLSLDPATLQPNAKPYLLQLKFDRSAIQKLLTTAGTSQLGQSRPQLLVWLAMQGSEQEPTILASDSDAPLQTQFKQAMAKRGLPLILPLMDMKDLTRVKSNDVWNLALNSLTNASERYASQGVLLGRIDTSDPNNVSSRWLLKLDNSEQQWNIPGKNVEEVLLQLTENISTTMLAHYGVTATTNSAPSSHASLYVLGITDPMEIDRIQNYLQHLAEVDHAELMNVSGDRAQFELGLRGDTTSLTRQIALGQLLTPVSDTGESSGNSDLIYQLLR